MKAAILVLAVISLVQADMYLHNPRGSNNRLDEANRERNNGNRLFDSQNNNRGGYNVGSVYYYEGSTVSIEWTNQHTCGDQNSHCEQIIQYMCDDRLRDGSSTSTIPEDPRQCDNFDCNNDLEYGMHEDFDYYSNCKLRERNMGLFLADRNLRGDTAKYTRQNQNGNRRGYECPEERDYYPYWHPTPWRDIVIFTTDVSRCPYYQRESENVKSRYACILPTDYINRQNSNNGRNDIIPITQEDCESIFHDDGTENGTRGVWQEFSPDSRLSAPECVEAQWSRDNHLGNTAGGFPMYYNWTVPNIPHEHCAIRIRYNISTAEYEAWEAVDGRNGSRNLQVFNGNGQGNLQNRRTSTISSVYDQFNLDFDTARQRGYVFRQNPVVKVFPDSSSSQNNFGLQLAINTNQFGRTFQDRGHSFAIRERSDELKENCNQIFNLNVRGKRGNIVQVYPGVEYDFVPNRLIASTQDCIHFQWTGSNTNPNNNDGQGRAGTDRSNVILLNGPRYPEGREKMETYGDWGTNYPEPLDSGVSFLGLSARDMQALATLDSLQYGGEMSELDDAGTYFDLGPRKVTMRGTYYYMCTRNNNFTNRGQKGKIIIQEDPLSLKRIGWTGGVVETPNARLELEQGVISSAVEFRLTDFASPEAAREDIQDLAGDGVSINLPGNEASGYQRIDPPVHWGTERMATVTINLDSNLDSSRVVIQRASASNSWVFEPLETTVENGQAKALTNEGGYFVASTPVQYGVVVGVPVAIVVILLVVIIAVGLVIYFRVRPEKWKSTKDNMQKTQMKIKRSFAKQI